LSLISALRQLIYRVDRPPNIRTGYINAANLHRGKNNSVGQGASKSSKYGFRSTVLRLLQDFLTDHFV
jgi:hypothetical protein